MKISGQHKRKRERGGGGGSKNIGSNKTSSAGARNTEEEEAPSPFFLLMYRYYEYVCAAKVSTKVLVPKTKLVKNGPSTFKKEDQEGIEK